jgi:RNA recognition motif-containing protein
MRLYVGNLPWAATIEDLEQLFQPYGIEGQVRVIIDRDTGRSKGYGFIDVAEGDRAIKELDGQDMKGRALRVNQALDKPRPDRGFNPRS